MFCKIRKGKETYSIYLCERERVDGRVVSNDYKIISFAWHSLYEMDEEYNGLIENIPDTLYNLLVRIILKKHDLDIFEDVVRKLIKIKKEYYTTYKEKSIQWDELRKVKDKEKLKEYEEFREKFKTLHYNEIMVKYKEGYDKGLIDGALKSNAFKNNYSGNNRDIGEDEKKLLKEAFKLLSHRHHPDKGGSTGTMAKINNLKEKIL
ncbi:hypothetical protein GCM10008904_14360 [Paraclostridium ghonii]|uniref:J domain-containing protein n=1 Tax=Paraclostridium ghonii TaxID=29358 RepID=A0ABU0MZV6_9FIRM|nr:hypothetical protein [Paeniclostridium ghonii]MDQ0556447.1 hypothetical protein [Paeniclostridium ghonii]